MATLNLQTPLTDAQVAAANAGADAVRSNIPNPVNLTKAERQSTPSIAEERAGMITDAENIALEMPALVSGFFGTTAQMQDAKKYFAQLQHLEIKLASTLEIIKDSRQMAGNFLYNFDRELYASCQRGAEANVPGCDAYADKLSVYFAQGTVTEPAPAG